jgi:hypothetical protein
MSMAAHAEVCIPLPMSRVILKPVPQTSSVVCGVNSPEDRLEKGFNENCRAYSVEDNQYAPIHAC